MTLMHRADNRDNDWGILDAICHPNRGPIDVKHLTDKDSEVKCGNCKRILAAREKRAKQRIAR